jgi:hypothetical protein
LQSATNSEEDEVKSRGTRVGEEDGGSPSGGGEEMEIVDGLAQLQVGNSMGHLTRNVRRRWNYHPFEPPPLHIFNQEERTTNSEVIGIGERVGGDRRKETSGEEGEVSATSPRSVSVLRTPTTNSQIRGINSRLRMVNQDSTLRLPMSHGMGKDDA